MAASWTIHHLKLHQLLLRQPSLLPQGAELLLAVSGGQDSMALTGLLLDLQRLHHWRLQLWHGNHNWREESINQANTLAAWAANQGLTIHLDHWLKPQATEAAAREWRYHCLLTTAQKLGCHHVVTAHTANDRSETLLLNLARGSHRRGLGSPVASRPLGDGIQLVRPILHFSREDTHKICQILALPIWLDPSNTDSRFSRNRVRNEVLPVLEQLHPGATQRIAATAEKFAAEQESYAELINLALKSLQEQGEEPNCQKIKRRQLFLLTDATRNQLLQQWLINQDQEPLTTAQINQLWPQLEISRKPNQMVLAKGRSLNWDKSHLWLSP
jgi:tRNA(Ile)-lysidine synthase